METAHSKAEQLAARMADVLVEHGEMGSGELAELLRENQHSSTWRKALELAPAEGAIRKVKHGVYGRGEARF